MRVFMVLLLGGLALAGCPLPMATTSTSTVDVDAALALFEGQMQRRVDLRNQVLAWSAEKDALLKAPASPDGQNPRILELAGLIANNLALLNEEDNAFTVMVRAAFIEARNTGSITITFPPPLPVASSTRPGAVAP